MPSDIRNRRQTWELSESDVTATLERIATLAAQAAASPEMDEELGRALRKAVQMGPGPVRDEVKAANIRLE